MPCGRENHDAIFFSSHLSILKVRPPDQLRLYWLSSHRLPGGSSWRRSAMATFTHDHVHLRSPDPEATAQYYERMFGAEVLRSMQQGKPRVDLNLCGLKVFIAQVMPDGKTGAAPTSPYLGLDHIGLTVSGIDAAVAELKAKGAEFTMEPTTIRPNVRIAFLRGPQSVSIELIDRNAA